MPEKRGEMKMLFEERISIIMPAYNAEKTITRAIDSIQRQTYKNWQLIIVMMVQKMLHKKLYRRSVKKIVE